MALPTVTTGTDLIEAALDLATPTLPQFLLGNPDDIADTTADAVVALASKLTVPLDPGRQMTLDLTAGAVDEALLAFSPSVAIASTTWDTLADGPCLLCRIGNAAVGLAGAVGDGLLAAALFVVDNPVTRTVAFLAFAVGTEVLLRHCVAAGRAICASVESALWVAELALNSADFGLVDAAIATFAEPYLTLIQAVFAGDWTMFSEAASCIARTLALHSGDVSSASGCERRHVTYGATASRYAEALAASAFCFAAAAPV